MASEKSKLEAILAKQESSVRRAFVTFLKDVRSDEVMREVRVLLSTGKLSQALDIVDSHVVSMANVIPRVFTDAGSASMSDLGDSVVRALGRAGARVSIGFDPTNDRAASIMRSNRLNFITGFTREQRNATRQALVRGLQTGAGTEETARLFRDSIGLTRAQLDSVESYRDALERQSADALRRVLRDRRFDSTVEGAIESGDPLSAEQIDRMVDRYQARFLAYRAENIARTESLRVTSQARQEALRQSIEQSGLDPDNVVRVWNATGDKRTRDSHRAMDGQEVGVDEPFVTPSGVRLMFPGDPNGSPEETINCRCTVTTKVLSTAEAA